MRPTQLVVTLAMISATMETSAVTGNAATAIIGVNAAVSTSIRRRSGGAMTSMPPAARLARWCSMYRSTPDTDRTGNPLARPLADGRGAAFRHSQTAG